MLIVDGGRALSIANNFFCGVNFWDVLLVCSSVDTPLEICSFFQAKRVLVRFPPRSSNLLSDLDVGLRSALVTYTDLPVDLVYPSRTRHGMTQLSSIRAVRCSISLPKQSPHPRALLLHKDHLSPNRPHRRP
jgi:hypothetical protein